MTESDSLPEFSESEEEEWSPKPKAQPADNAVEADGAEGDEASEEKPKKEKKKKVKVDPPLMNRPTTPDDFDRFEPEPYQVLVSAFDLPNGDKRLVGGSLSDPRCILYMKDEPTGKWFEVGRTERIKDTLDPEWTTRIDVDYFENEDDECRFEIYDWNKDYVDLKKHDFLGQWSGPLSTLIKGGDFFNVEQSMSNRDSTGPNKKVPSRIKIGAMPASGRKVFFQFQFEGVNIDKASKSGKTDAYLEMAVSTENQDEFVTIHRTEVIKKTTDPQWEKFQLTINQLKSDVSDRSLRLTVNHWSKKGPKEIGQCITTFAQLKEMKESGEDVEFVLINEEKKNGKKADTYENSGIVKLVYFKKKKERVARPKRTQSKLTPEAAAEDGIMTLEIKEPYIEDNGLSDEVASMDLPGDEEAAEPEEE